MIQAVEQTNMFYAVILVILKICIASVLLSALFSKRTKRLFDPLENSAISPSFLDFLSKVHGPYVIALAYLLLGTFPGVALVMLAVMMLSGYLGKRTGLIGACNCYGELATSGSRWQAGFDWALILMSSLAIFIMAYERYGGRTANAEGPPLLFLVTLLLAAMLASANDLVIFFRRVVPLSTRSPERLTESVEQTGRYSRDMSVGKLENGDVISLGQIADTCPMILFIGLSNDCSACKVLKPLLVRIAEVFGQNLRTVFLVEGYVNDEGIIKSTLMLRGNKEFLSIAGGEKFPFGLVVNSATLQRAGAVEYGENIGTLLLRVLSVATSSRGSN